MCRWYTKSVSTGGKEQALLSTVQREKHHLTMLLAGPTQSRVGRGPRAARVRALHPTQQIGEASRVAVLRLSLMNGDFPWCQGSGRMAAKKGRLYRRRYWTKDG